MPDSLADILGKRSYDEPPEVTIIKNYIREKLRSDASVAIRERQIIITVKGAALAGALRMHLYQLKELCKTEKRLIIRIS